MPEIGPKRPTPVKLGLWPLGVLAIYGISAYIIMPNLWRMEIVRHPALQGAPRITHTAAGIHGDPLNIALIATEAELVRAMLTAGWHPADPLTLKSSLRIASSTVFHRSYIDAPVSHLYLWGRKEDLAFEQPVGNDPARRHQVRFWRSPDMRETGQVLWLGAASCDASVGLGHTTGQVTHHIAPDVDAERDKIMQDLQRAGQLGPWAWVEHFHRVLTGYNGGGDPYHTDGRWAVGMIIPQAR